MFYTVKTSNLIKTITAFALILMLLVGLLATSLIPAHAAPTTWTVTTTGDTTTSCTGTSCPTLRDAITAASSGDTIVFSTSGTIILGSTLKIRKSLTIDGAGQITIDGANTYEIFDVASSTLSLKGLTLQHGSNFDGSAILNDRATVNVTDSTFLSNISTIAIAGGGAIENNGGTLTVTNSTFSGNTAINGYGGAINNNGSVSIINSTFFGNSAAQSGGAIINGGTMTIVNSTFSGNSAASGGAIDNDGSNATMTFTNSIVANSSSGNNCLNNGGTFNVSGTNLSSDTTCAGFTFHNTNPQLAVLANNGGFTQTMALPSSSPAIDAVPAGQCTVSTDQRGTTRPQGTLCDLGAYELLVVATATQTPTATATAVKGSSNAPGQPLGVCALLNSANTAQVRAIVPANIATTGNIPVNLCYGVLTDPVQIGVTDRAITVAVEVVAYTKTNAASVAPLTQPVTICLGGSGLLLYRDATGQPRVVNPIPAYSEGGYTCGSVPNAGTVILVLGAAAPVGGESSGSAASHSLSMCSVTTNGILNLHERPDGNSTTISLVPNATSLQATARSGEWIQVMYGSTQGWLAVRYLTLDGNCQ